MDTSIITPGYLAFVSRANIRRFAEPRVIVQCHRVEDVKSSLENISAHVNAGGYAAGYIAYEAARAFDPVLTTHAECDVPLLWFGLYDSSPEISPGTRPGATSEQDAKPFRIGEWRARVDDAAYRDAVDRIREYIAAGDTYQVNYTFPLDASFEGDSFAWFQSLCASQQADHCAYIHIGTHTILSASPELFFHLKDGIVTTRPMKGTRARALSPDADRAESNALQHSDKDRAENVMIVDMHRNDLGKIAEQNSVCVRSLFDIERYPTLWQMTSTVEAHTCAPVPEILAALFPSASVTGAPKVRTMEIIAEMEPFPRGVYCGAIGWWGPDNTAEFNVAIRTVTIDNTNGTVTYHVGGGITWDSTAQNEYAECQAKTAFLLRDNPTFELLESMLYEVQYSLLEEQYYLLERHLDRLSASADYFGFSFDRAAIVQHLLDVTNGLPSTSKVRLLLARDGTFRTEAGPATPKKPVRLGLAREAIDRNDLFLYHKTTHRVVYEHAIASRPDYDDVLLWNQDGEITESCSANIVLWLGDAWVTPPVSSGLLGGTFRRELLERGEIVEGVVRKDEIFQARSIRLINSVRKWIEVEFVD